MGIRSWIEVRAEALCQKPARSMGGAKRYPSTLCCAHYGSPPERVYAHNWIDFKNARYCEGCALATTARQRGE
ncbi:hypothetical protein M2222_007543 [Bradyrhizobium elkanii]|jgi:hypothetical protein|nr:hypothetical protein [Bradyrhizobium elkanii]MCS3565221.1 hypothetical protein [Bradyrhizobium elkanii]MCW2144951.1 hypothetical protein [Bradyrhizobium elkanii]MCW2356232.1 hypothetical protein [Bradyrhizobium elkanii]MCW2377777.1 hypothetical protein [Bradyrhizobium elkanii]